MARARATAEDVLDLLNNHSGEVIRRLDLPLREVQLSMPTVGPPRIRVSVKRGAADKIPASLDFMRSGRTVQVPLEAVEDFQSYSPY